MMQLLPLSRSGRQDPRHFQSDDGIMINKLALHYKVEADGLNRVEAALLEVAPRIRKRLASEEGARVRVASARPASVFVILKKNMHGFSARH